MLIRWSAFEKVGHFDAICDGYGGMEDLHFIMSMMLNGNFNWKILDLKIRLIVGKNHNQVVKEQREVEAMQKIASYFRDAVDGIPELVERVELTLRSFKLSTGFRLGDVVTWTGKAIAARHGDLLDSALVRAGDRLEVVGVSKGVVTVRDAHGYIFPANTDALQLV
jgi:hypothetical protein